MNTTPTPNQKNPDMQSTTSSRRWLWLPLIIVLAVAAYFIWGRKPATPAGADAAIAQAAGKQGKKGGGRGMGGGANMVMPVGVATAKTDDVHIYLSGLGGVTPIATTVVNSQVTGQLTALDFTEGEIVKKGALLAQIDPRPFQVAITEAEGALARDAAQLKAAQVDLQRYRTLLAQDSIASQQVDTQAALVKQYEGTVKTDQGTLDNARLQLTYSRITAPIGGRLGLRTVDLGNNVQANGTTGIVSITQLQPITVVFSIPEDNIPAVMKQIQAGKKLYTEAWDRAQTTKLAEGTLLTIDNQVDSTTGTIKLKAQFPNTNYNLFPQQFVNAKLLLDTLHGATVIPNSAIQRGSDGLYVYVVKADNTVTLRNIVAGPVEGEQTAITSGVQVGDVVVVDGIDKLREGAKVEPIKRGAGGALGDAQKMTAADTPKHGHHHGQDQTADAGTTKAAAATSASSAAPIAANTDTDASKTWHKNKAASAPAPAATN